MQKEIFEQPRAIADTLEGVQAIVPELFDGAGSDGKSGVSAWRVFKEIDRVLILACGTSYYSGCTAKYWIEALAGRSEEHTSELQSLTNLVCRLLLEKKKNHGH